MKFLIVTSTKAIAFPVISTEAKRNGEIAFKVTETFRQARGDTRHFDRSGSEVEKSMRLLKIDVVLSYDKSQPIEKEAILKGLLLYKC